MENAVDALKMAFAIFVFVIAIGIAFTVFFLFRIVDDEVLHYTDKTNYGKYVNESPGNYRIVGLETVIPAIRRYVGDNEGYSVRIQINGTIKYVFDGIEDENKNLSPTQIETNLENNLKEIIKNYSNATFEEHIKVTRYRGDVYVAADGETVEKKNTDEKVEITYIKK